jgi:diguanylate cyclase (GGDEF)-like protein
MKRSKEYINNDNIKNKKYSIIMADLDNFKNINDTFGHQKGDEVLKGISGIIKKNIRPFDIAARYGGEEFIIGLENTDLYTAGKIAERIRRKIEEKQLMKNIRNLTISIGVSNYPKDSILLTELISKADSRLYKAKRQGKNQVCKI